MEKHKAVIFAAFFAALVPASPARAAIATLAVPAGTAPSLDPAASVSAWPAGGALTLPWDVIDQRNASEATAVHVVSDGTFLYVRFDAAQTEPVVATQHSNDTITGGSQGNGGLSWSADDAVWVDLWPTGPTGFAYQFESNAIGAHNESSSENAAFAPHWASQGAVHDGGYTVTMAIPLNVIHGAKTGAWRGQFIRYVRATGAEIVWSFDAQQTSADDRSRAGNLTLTLTVSAPVPPPRAGVYVLGAAASAPAGGPTSRAGADVSVPVTATAAFFATFHPDYSNVELDQQTIAPSVYQRQYSEVRPFFTQAASYYNTSAFNCYACSGPRYVLYTPAIPTPSQGYAFEGKADNLSFTGFDAIGAGRTDAAGVASYASPDSRWNAALQHVTSDQPGLVDDANIAGVGWSDLVHLSAYVNGATDAGTNVPDPGQGKAIDAGGGYSTGDFGIFGSLRNIGSEFDPADGLVWHPGIAGYSAFTTRFWTFKPASPIASMGFFGFIDRYAGPVGGQAQSDNQILFDVLTKSAWDLQLYSGSDYWRFGPTLEPISQNGGASITYGSGLSTTVGSFPSHGGGAYPTQVNYVTGRYGLGRLDTWTRTSTIKAGRNGSVTFTLDDTAQWLTPGPSNIQWFDEVAYTDQLSAESSFAIGLRRVVGNPPQPNGGGNCAGVCSNVSLAYHLRLHDEEFYLAYGNPNTLITVPEAILKVIFYLGGQKGT